MKKKLKKSNMGIVGLRETLQRKAILQYLSNVNEHPTVKEIHSALKKDIPNLSVATVYQNLKILTKYCIIKEINIKNMPSRYDANIENHYHIICQSCGNIKDFNYPVFTEIENVAGHLFNYEVYSHSLEIYGVCEKCQSDKAYWSKYEYKYY